MINLNDAHVCSLRRVARVVTGGKVFKISALVVLGDKKSDKGVGRVGYGMGKSSEAPAAITKASKIAGRNLIVVPIMGGRTVYHDVVAKYGASKVIIKKAKEGTGVVAGGSMRYVMESLGLKDVVCKSYGSSNPHSVVKATFKALQKIKNPVAISKIRGLNMECVRYKRKNCVEDVK